MTADVLSVEPGRYCPRCGELNDDEHRCAGREAPSFPPGYVTHASNAGYFVQSRTTLGVWYLTTGDTCSCPAGKRGQRCWHQSQALEFAKRVNEKFARPAAPSAPLGFFFD